MVNILTINTNFFNLENGNTTRLDDKFAYLMVSSLSNYE